MSVTVDLAYDLLLARRDRAGLALPPAQEAYYKSALSGAQEELANAGIHLTNSTADTLLLVDVAAWNLSNRDKAEGMPQWLRLKRRERWLRERRTEG